MPTLKEVQTKILNLINENSSSEEAEKISAISKDLDSAIQDETAFAEKHEELRKKYVELVKNGNFGTEENVGEKKAKSFEEITKDIIKRRK